MLAQWIFAELNFDINTSLKNDPFIRIWDKNNTLNTDKVKEIELKYENGIHSIDTVTFDDILLRALYCDFNNYSDFDYYLLQRIRDNIGGYGDTHFLIGLLLLNALDCGNNAMISNDISKVVIDIREVQKNDAVFSDLYAERIVVLVWAGKIDSIEKKWIKKLIKNQNNDGSWSEPNNYDGMFHTTGLSTLSLKYYLNKRVDNIWFIK